MAEQARCQGKTKGGRACRSFALAGGWCFMHDPAREQERQAARAKGAQAAGQLRKLRAGQPSLRKLPGVARYLAEVVVETRQGRLDHGVARAVIYGLSTLRALLEASDLEKRIEKLERKVGLE